jgi:hypothetical protein
VGAADHGFRPGVEFPYLTYEVRRASSPGDIMMRRQGREYGLVLNGQLELTMQFDTHHRAGGRLDLVLTPPTRTDRAT